MKLFQPIGLGTMNLSDRLVMAPMTRSRADLGNAHGQLAATHYGQRADARLIITEITAPSPSGLGYPCIPGIFNTYRNEGWSGVTQAVHARGGHIFLRLMRVGRVAHKANLPAGAEAVARESGLTDLVAFGRPFISNPDFVVRMRNNWPLADPDMGTLYTPTKQDFTDYPEYGSFGD